MGLAFLDFLCFKFSMNNSDQNRVFRIAKKAAIAGGKITLKYFKRLKSVSVKRNAGLVSEADRESEEKIRRIVKANFPGHRFLGEEGGYSDIESDFLWVVDPLDGTTNYVHGFPFFCVSIGVERNGIVEVGVVHAPLLNATYTAIKGRGAYLNGKKISVSRSKDIRESLLATGFSYKKNVTLESEIRDFKSFAAKSRGIRRAGSAALDFCMVASGVFDGFWERALAPWDTSAGSLIVQEAGGLVTNYKGEPFVTSMNSVAAGNPHIHPQIIRILKKR